jgi:hypothetical protein
MTDGEHLTSKQVWLAWKKACAADLCTAEQRSALQKFGTHRFCHFLARYASSFTGHSGPVMKVAEARDAWHLLESYCQINTTRQGKRYKDWLLNRQNDDSAMPTWLASVESGATLLMRDVVRDYLRSEHAASFMTSMQRPLAGETFTLEDLLPDAIEPADEISRREWAALARDQAMGFLPTLTKREAMVVWARGHEIALTDPRLQDWAGSRTSTLHKDHRDSVARLGRMVKKAYPEESPAVWTHIALLAWEEIGRQIFSHYFPQEEIARFFKEL